MRNLEIITWFDHHEKEQIEGAKIIFENSTSTARIFTLAMKMQCLDWTEPLLDTIENLVDNRLLEIKNGHWYQARIIRVRKNLQGLESKLGFNIQIRALSKTRARQIIKEAYPKDKIESIKILK